MITLWNSTKNKVAALFGLTLFCAGFMVSSVHAGEVSTKIVGFVKAQIGPGNYFFSIPFQDVGEIDDTQLHFLNIDSDNDGTLDTFSPGLFSDENFSTGDAIRKFDKNTGRLTEYYVFRNTFSPGQPTRTGWCTQPPGTPFWSLTDAYFEVGESFLVEFADANHVAGEELFFLGQVNEYNVEIPMPAGYKLIGLPYPSEMTIQEAFQEGDNDTYSPTACTGTMAPDTSTGDSIRLGYDSTTKAWLRMAVYWDKPGTGKGWYYQPPGLPFWLLVPTDPADANYDAYLLKPSKGYLYYAKQGFIWQVESPVSE